MKSRYELLIIGAGPAGMSAAALAAEHGAEVAVLDEQPAPGGQIYRAVEATPEHLKRTLGPDYRRGEKLVRAFRDSGAGYFSGTGVWSLSAEREVGVLAGGAARRVRAQRVLIAIGAMERAVPFPGWTLPGVMNAGAGQILMKSAGLVPDAEVVLAGCGPLLLLLAWQYLRAGVQVKGVLELSPPANLLRALPHLPAALSAHHYITKGLGYLLALRRAGVPVIGSVRELRALGNEALEAVEYRRGKRVKRIDTPLLLVHFGLVPNAHLARSAGCAYHWDDSQQCWRPQLDEWGNSSLDGIAIAGDNAHIGGARAAEHAGRLAALEALHSLGRLDAAQRDRLAGKDRQWMHADLRIRPFLERMYRLPQDPVSVPDDTFVCRCEEVTAGQVREAIRDGHTDVNQVKFLTRCGMGPCQGRQCGDAVGRIVAGSRGCGMEEAGYYRIRPPAKPLTLEQLAALDAADATGSDSPAVKPHRTDTHPGAPP